MNLHAPAALICILLLLVYFSEWLGCKPYFRRIGTVLIILISSAVLSNLDVIPSFSKGSPVYDAIFTYAAPLGIFFLMLDVKLKQVRKAGLPMILMFCVGSLAAVAGDIASYYIIQPQVFIDRSYAVAGMFTGTYVGGSANLNAIALHYEVNKDGTIFAAVNAADNIASALWIMMLIVVVPFFNKLKPREIINHLPDDDEPSQEASSIRVKHIALLLLLGFSALLFSQYISDVSQKRLPSILVLTTIALVCAQLPFANRLGGSRIVGYLLILLFLAVVGAFCDIGALMSNGKVAVILFSWITLLILIHGVLIFSIGFILKQDWYVIAIASIAGIGGPTSSAAVATTMGREDLRLPAILVGTSGYAVGTYLGIMVAEALK